MQIEFGTEERKITGELIDSRRLRQSFNPKRRILKAVNVQFATYCRRNTSQVVILIMDCNKNVVSQNVVSASVLKDNQYFKFNVNQELNSNSVHELIIYTRNANVLNTVTAKWGKKSHNGYFYIGNERIDGELNCSFEYDGEEFSEIEQKEEGEDLDVYNGLISVVIPSYDCEDFLEACLISISKQTYNFIEVFVVDDGSKRISKTQSIIKSFQQKRFFPVDMISHGRNRGAPAARNTGYRQTSGEYLFFLDADCNIEPDAFEGMITALFENPMTSC